MFAEYFASNMFTVTIQDWPEPVAALRIISNQLEVVYLKLKGVLRRRSILEYFGVGWVFQPAALLEEA